MSGKGIYRFESGVTYMIYEGEFRARGLAMVYTVMPMAMSTTSSQDMEYTVYMKAVSMREDI